MEKQNNSNEVKRSSRRTFLTRASAGVLMASLPAKSVWASGGNVAGSIIASGNSSDWAGGNPIHLRSHGYWKTHINKNGYDPLEIRKKTFKNVFGSQPTDDVNSSILVVREKIDALGNVIGSKNWHPKISHCVRSEGDSGVPLNNSSTNEYPFVTNSSINPTFLDKYYKPNQNGDTKPLFDFSGASNVNAQMCAMYLNAAYHGTQGIYYPVLQAYGGPFATLDAFADNLITLRDINGAAALGSALAQLISQNPA